MQKRSLFFLFILFNCYVGLAQSWQWATPALRPHGGCEAWPITADKFGNVYASAMVVYNDILDTMSIFGTDTIVDYNDYQTLLTRMDSNGTFKWAIGTQNAFTEVLSKSIVTDTLGNVYQLGYFEAHDTFGVGPTLMQFGGHTIVDSQSWSGYYYLTKVDSGGNVKWLKKLAMERSGGTFAPLYASGAIGMDYFGNIYVCGAFASTTTVLGSTVLTNADPGQQTSDIFLAKLDTAGNTIWARRLGGDSTEYNVSLAVAPRGEVYLVGKYKSHSLTIGGTTLTNTTSPHTANLFVIKYDAAGNARWAKGIVNPAFYENTTIATDIYNNIYIGGAFSGTITFGAYSLSSSAGLAHMYIACYDSAGNVRWAKRQNSSPSDITTYSIAPDACGRIWAAAGGLSTSSTEPVMFIQYDTAGQAVDSTTIPVGGDDDMGIAVDNNGNLYVCGDYIFPATIGPSILPLDSASEAFFVAKYKYSYTHCIPPTVPGLEVEEVNNGQDIVLYPNPSSGELTLSSIQSFPADSKLVIFDITGRSMRQYVLGGNRTVLNIEDLPIGVYQCNIYAGGERIATQKLVISR